MESALFDEIKWLDNFDFHSPDPSPETKAWAQYHAGCKRNIDCTPGINAIMPLLREPVHTLQMQYHCMTITKTTIDAVNHGQTPVDVSDQPVYALSKEIQWRYPSLFSDYFPMMGHYI